MLRSEEEMSTAVPEAQRDAVGLGISLASLREGDAWEDAFKEQISARVWGAIGRGGMQEAEADVEELAEELDDFHRHLQTAAEKALLLQRDAILQADKHFIGKAEAGEATPKDLPVALRAHVRATFCRDHHGRPWSLLGTSSDQLKLYGPGVHLYFLFTEHFLKFMLLAACLSTPLMLTHAWGQGLRKYGGGVGGLMTTTAGNVGAASFAIGSWTATDVTYYCGLVDAVVVLIIYLATLYFELWVMPQVNGKEAKCTATPTAFSVFVDCLPAEIGRGEDYEVLLRAHFESLLRAEVTPAGALPGLRVLVREEPDSEALARPSWGPVGQRAGQIVGSDGESCEVRWLDTKERQAVAVLREDGGAALVDASRLERMEQCRCAVYAKEAMSGSGSCGAGASVHQVVLVRDFGGRFGREDGWCPDEKTIEDLPVLGAFVVFRHAVHRDFLLHREYRFSRTCLGRALQPASLRLEGKPIRLGEAPAPSDIFWSNMDFPGLERLLRKGLIALCCSIMLMVCVVLFALGKNASASAREEQQSSLSCAQGLNATLANQTGGDCMCSRAGYSKVLADDPPGIYDLCTEWLAKVALMTALSMTSALVSTVVSFAIGYIVEFMAKFARPKSVSHLELSIMQMTFVFKLLTLGVVVVVVNADFGFSFLGLRGILGLIGSGEFSDVSPKWFAEVGWQVVLINLFGLLNPVLFGAQALLYHLWCWWKRRRLTAWEDLKSLYTPPQFPFAMQHAEVLSAIVLTLVFSSGMPILTVVLFVRLALHCLADRFTLFHSSCIPPRYTHHLALAMSGWLKAAAWSHSLVAIWVFGNDEVYPSYSLFEGYESSSAYLHHRAYDVFHRSVQAAAFPNTCVLLLITGVAVVRLLIFVLGWGAVRAFAVAALHAAWRKCLHVARSGKRREQHSMSGQSAFDQKPMEEMKRKHIVHSYDPFDLPEYRSRRPAAKLKEKALNAGGAGIAATHQEPVCAASGGGGAAKSRWPASLQDAPGFEQIVIGPREAPALGGGSATLRASAMSGGACVLGKAALPKGSEPCAIDKE